MNKLFKIMILGSLTSIFLFSMSVCASSISDGKYIMNTNTYYLNPDTGKTDDGGSSNIELGEGMCRSVLHKTALVEQSNGITSVTIRMLLYSNISDIRIAVQESPKGNYNDVKYSVLKESSSNDSADIKFVIPDAESYVRIKMYVVPMGRDVCFYWNCDTATVLNSDGELSQQEAGLTEKTIADQFTDINNHWAENAIKSVVNKGLFTGTTDVLFSPDKEMTRGMFVTVLGRLSGDEILGVSNFIDVSTDKYYSTYIAWASKNGIVNGTSSSNFSPDMPVTCEQAAVILIKYASYKNVEFQSKSISPSTTGVSEWAKEHIIKAGRAGLITKQNTNGYDYTSYATRADIASMIYNYIEFYGA